MAGVTTTQAMQSLHYKAQQSALRVSEMILVAPRPELPALRAAPHWQERGGEGRGGPGRGPVRMRSAVHQRDCYSALHRDASDAKC